MLFPREFLFEEFHLRWEVIGDLLFLFGLAIAGCRTAPARSA